MRVGIMGGTLDPVHNGHIEIASEVMNRLKLDRMMLLPAGDPPHKARPISKEDRFAMVRLAADSHEGLFACGIEIYRKGTTYTVDTLEELSRANPNVEWFYVIGQDTLAVLDTWRNFPRVAQLCTFAVVGRADQPVDLARAREFETLYGARFEILPFNGPDISSTMIRNRVAAGESIDKLVPRTVADYIRRRGLYLCSMSLDDVKTTLQKALKPSRYTHTLGVAETAKRLAERYGIDSARAELAALLHDCAKYLSVKEMSALIEENIKDADADEMKTISVLHAPAGAVLAQTVYGVRDPEIISAIRKHTLGADEMSPLDALIYTADFIEPNRQYFPGLEDARALAEVDIYAAMCKCAELTNKYVSAQGNKPHRRSLALLNKYSRLKV